MFSSDSSLESDAEGNVPLPEKGKLDIYDAGFECQDNSSRNQNRKDLVLRWDAVGDESCGMSSQTVMASDSGIWKSV